MVAHGLRHRPRARDKDSGTNHVLVNLWLTLYKLTGWLVSLDLRKPNTDASSTTEMTTPYALSFRLGYRGKLDKSNHKRFGGEHPENTNCPPTN